MELLEVEQRASFRSPLAWAGKALTAVAVMSGATMTLEQGLSAAGPSYAGVQDVIQFDRMVVQGPRDKCSPACTSEKGIKHVRKLCQHEVLVMTGAAVSAGADVVEMGTFIGAGSLVLSAGLSSSAASLHGQAPVHHGFDFFKATDMNLPKIRRYLGRSKAGRTGGSYARFWTEPTQTVYPHVVAHPGNIVTSVAKTAGEWGGRPVDVFCIDSAKTHTELKEPSAAIWKKLRKGSIIVLMDFMKSSQPLLVYHVLKPAGMVKLAWHALTSSPVAYFVTTENSDALNKAVYAFSPDKLHTSEREAALQSYQADLQRYAASYFSPPNGMIRRGQSCMEKALDARRPFFWKQPWFDK